MTQSIGYYSVLVTPDKKGYIGALLVIDDTGKPEEFRVTYPVKPTELQRQLYGDSLFPHVGIELCGKPLYQSLKQKLALLVVANPKLLPIADVTTCPVVYLQRLGETMQVNVEKTDSSEKETKLLSPSGLFQPIVFTCPSGYSDDRKTEAKTLMEPAFAAVDLLEPFHRILVAIEVLGRQDQKFS